MIRPDSFPRISAFLDAWLTVHAEAETIPGFSVAVYQHSQPVYRRAFGFSELAGRQPLTLNHRFNIGSQAKLLTAVLCMQLAHTRKLDLSDPVSHYLPWLINHPDRRLHTMSIEQLLWHGSGLPREGHGAQYWLLEQPFPTAKTIEQTVLSAKLSDRSGLRFKYSNLGYALLGLVIEAVCQKPYRSVAEDYIIKPLRLKNTHIADSRPFTGPTATGYLRRQHGKRDSVPIHIPLNDFASVCGWYSTVDDMATLLQVFCAADDRLLPRQTKTDLMQGRRHHWQPQSDRGTEYGLGFMQHSLDGQRIYGHSGAFVGHLTCTYSDPASGLTVAVMTNAQDAPLNEMAFGIFTALRHFALYDNAPPASEQERWNLCLENILTVKYIVALTGKTVSVPLDDWTPFEAAETLTPAGTNRFRISEAFDMHAVDEIIEGHFDEAGNISHVDYAGIAMQPSTRRPG